ncbi:MAG TPA: hypothetical protein VHU18_12895 [Rhizomicrobium sp.]|jgi:hypothetical protein|nr:hypothetical protein [Rhizomicrobium sp.]
MLALGARVPDMGRLVEAGVRLSLEAVELGDGRPAVCIPVPFFLASPGGMQPAEPAVQPQPVLLP